MKHRPFLAFFLAALAASAAGAGGASATTWLVPGDGSNTCTAVSPNCDTIAEAVAASAAADTIELAPGSHAVAATQELSLRPGLTIRGAGIASTTIEPSAGVIAFNVRSDGIT